MIHEYHIWRENMPKNLEAKAKDCAALIKASNRIVLLSGAGMSTSSGLPDFRGPKGIYKHKMGVDPELIFEIGCFRKNPAFFYRFHREFLKSLQTIEPTFSHRFFAFLEQKGKMSGIVTQNIDALHQRAGSKNVFEIHGSVWKSFCTNCGREWNYEDSVSLAFSCDVPRCDNCNGLIKPDVVFFGEIVKQLEESRDLARSADLFFVVGSSLNVTPAALLPSMTRGEIVVVNKGEISGFHLPQESVRIFAEEDIDTFFQAVDKAMRD